MEISGEWIVGDLTGTGILVAHNSSNTACLKNLNTGTFKGLIIADNFDKIKSNIYGAVFFLNHSAAGNCEGNGNGNILYSSQAVSKAFWTAGSITLTWQEK